VFFDKKPLSSKKINLKPAVEMEVPHPAKRQEIFDRNIRFTFTYDFLQNPKNAGRKKRKRK